MHALAPTASTVRMQRAEGDGRLTAGLRDGATRLRSLHQAGAAKIRLPRVAEGPLEAILINTAGGLTGGDRIAWTVELAAGAGAAVTTQACERIYRTVAGPAEVTCRLTVAKGARLAWLPQETIVFDRSAFSRHIEVDLEAGAELLLCEATVFGRGAMGETVARAEFRDRWRIRAGGELVHAEDLRLGPDVADALGRRAVTGGGIAIATALLVADDAVERLEPLRAASGESLAASAWRVGRTGKLLARFVARDGYTLRASLMPVLGLLNGKAGLPKAWAL